jgi:hypothetical protein
VRRIVPVLALALFVLCLMISANPAQAATTAAAPVGVVMLGQGALVSQIPAQNGTSLYAGDTLNTDATGSLRVRFGTSQLMLGPATVVKVAEGKNGVALVLQHGIVRFSAAGSPLELRALAAIVQPGDDASGQISIVGPSEFQIGSTKGNLNVDIDGVDKVVAESTAYDVTLEPAPGQPDTVGGGKVRGLWILISLIALLTALGLWAALLSDSHFVSH